jgi:predicted GNAT family acetyltransferase
VHVVDENDRGRFAVYASGEAEMTYRLNGDRLVLTHIGVPSELEGQGIATQLVQAAVDRARATGETIVPICPFARRWIRTHPEAVGDIGLDWRRTSP